MFQALRSSRAARRLRSGLLWGLSPSIALAFAAPAFGCAGGQAQTDARSARVAEIYPSSNELPENLLRFYVYFTQPMERGEVLGSIALLDEERRPIDGAFLENRYRLWSPDDRRLTLIFDPGRVKTGLKSHRQLGRALAAGRRYVLRIGKTALSANGCPLAEVFEKEFTATAEDRSSPDPGRWRLDVPRIGTLQALEVELDGPYDHLSLAYRVRVLDPLGNVVPGRVELDEGESRWLFKPTTPWRAAVYQIAVETSLEDLAGNRPGRLFDLPPSPEGHKKAGDFPNSPSPPLEISFTPLRGLKRGRPEGANHPDR
ncbi:MAG: hypothetical protein AAF725_21740 [Acidobacteriota bacterium]